MRKDGETDQLAELLAYSKTREETIHVIDAIYDMAFHRGRISAIEEYRDKIEACQRRVK